MEGFVGPLVRTQPCSPNKEKTVKQAYTPGRTTFRPTHLEAFVRGLPDDTDLSKVGFSEQEVNHLMKVGRQNAMREAALLLPALFPGLRRVTSATTATPKPTEVVGTSSEPTAPTGDVLLASVIH